MFYTVSAKNCTLSDKWLALIERKVKQLVERMPFTNTDPVLLRFTINRHRRGSGYYDGDILLGLPNKPLYARFEGWEAPEALIQEVFDHILRELRTFRGKHLKSDSEYYQRDSIRAASEYFVTPDQWKRIDTSFKKPEQRKKRLRRFEELCSILVEDYIKPQGVRDRNVLLALKQIPRHLFVPSKYRDEAYLDVSLPTRAGQIVSQPSLVGIMAQALKLTGREKILEIGTGTGYMSAVLSLLARNVYTIELLPSLARKAKKTLASQGHKNVHCFVGDGLPGLPQYAPFDAIVVDCAITHVPSTWIEQLKEDGRIVVPIGKNCWDQRLMAGVRKKGKVQLRELTSIQVTPIIETKKLSFHKA